MQPPISAQQRYQAFDLLATLIAVVQSDGSVVFVNAAMEDALGTSRRVILGAQLPDFFTEPQYLRNILHDANGQDFATLRCEATLLRGARPPLPVHAVVTCNEGAETIIELLLLQQQARQEREERLTEQALANKELIRNLAHEIKNPLGGIRGAAQLLEMELGAPDLGEYTQVIIHEVDRLQSLVDRLLAPQRKAHLVCNVNIHEVCERVRALILAEFPKGLVVVQDYDTSIPELLGDCEQLIAALLNIARNACQALAERIEGGDARIIFRTRIARQVTLGKQRHRLALQLHVIDNGPGIPESIKERIFYPLVSAREGGFGLGLTLAQTFIQQHQGLIECSSAAGLTDFKILIPLP